MLDFEFMLFDRIEKIRQINNEYDLEKNSYIAFSGGKDSLVLSYLLDLALPNNKIPRVNVDTGIEYKYMREFVTALSKEDQRIVILKPTVNIKKMLEENGYPFKSKEHSKKVYQFQQGYYSNTIKQYITGVRLKDDQEIASRFKCPDILQYQFTPSCTLKISHKCCLIMKERPMTRWGTENKRKIFLTGMRSAEGGQRKLGHCLNIKNGNLVSFNPLMPVDNEFINAFIDKYNIKLCKLYYPPFNFERTGCKGCPFALELQNQLDTMSELLPNEKKQCEYIWRPVYEEYRRLGYRLRENGQLTIYDFFVDNATQRNKGGTQ